MNETSLIRDTAAEFRQAFDRSFTMPPPQVSQDADDLLAIRVGGDPYAIRLRDIVGIVAGRPVVPVPSRRRDLLGLAGIRGGIVPVFGLTSILGYGHTADTPRWMVLCGTDELIALALADFEGHLRLPSSCLYADERVDENVPATRRYVQQFASTDSGVRAVINIPLVIATIRNRIDTFPPTSEQ